MEGGECWKVIALPCIYHHVSCREFLNMKMFSINFVSVVDPGALQVGV